MNNSSQNRRAIKANIETWKIKQTKTNDTSNSVSIRHSVCVNIYKVNGRKQERKGYKKKKTKHTHVNAKLFVIECHTTHLPCFFFAFAQISIFNCYQNIIIDLSNRALKRWVGFNAQN